MSEICPKDAAARFVRTGRWEGWLDRMNADYVKAFWMWVRAMEVR